MSASSVAAQSARDILGAAGVVPLDSEPAPFLVVDPPLPGPLSFGRVVIQYRADVDGLRALMLFLVKDCCAGSPELCAPLISELACC